MSQAFELMRRYARSHNERLVDIARGLAELTLDPAQVTTSAPPSNSPALARIRTAHRNQAGTPSDEPRHSHRTSNQIKPRILNLLARYRQLLESAIAITRAGGTSVANKFDQGNGARCRAASRFDVGWRP
jgi:hypothetical protein